MGSKGSPPPPVSEPPAMDMGMYMQMMNSAMMNQQAMMADASSQYQLPDTPEPYTSPDIDWAEKNKELSNKAKADFEDSTAKKKGRSSTILTSPLADDEEADTTKSVLGS